MAKSRLFICLLSFFLLSLSLQIGAAPHAVQVPATASEDISFSVNELHLGLKGILVENISTAQAVPPISNRTFNNLSLSYLIHASASSIRHNFLQPNNSVYIDTVLRNSLSIFNRVLRI